MFKFIIEQLKYFLVLFRIKKFFFLNARSEVISSKIILCEFNNFASVQIPFFYFINYFLTKEKYTILGFYNYDVIKHKLSESFIIKFLRKNFFNFITKKIYFHFNFQKIIYPEAKLSKQVIKNFKRIKQIKKKEDILNIKISNILIGDLLYDTYCKKYHQPTLNLNDQRYEEFLLDFLQLFNFWFDFFKKNSEISKVCGSHLVYSYGVIFRIALNFKKDVFLINLDRIKKVNKNFPYEIHYSDFNKTRFKKIKLKLRKKILHSGRKLLINQFNGKSDYTNSISTLAKNSFSRSNEKSLIKSNNNIKILISPHDFYDAPHVWGNHGFFSDYYDWLVFILNISRETKYDWYIKAHPDLVGIYGQHQRLTRRTIENLLKEYPNVKILPPNYSNFKILRDKIDLVITCHGSVAYEFPFYGIPTMTCSKSSPFINYNFNIKPKSRSDIKKFLLNIRKTKRNLKIHKENIFYYFTIRFVFYNTTSWLFPYKQYTSFINGWYRRDSLALYNYWLKYFNKIQSKNINRLLDNFFQLDLKMLDIAADGYGKNNEK